MSSELAIALGGGAVGSVLTAAIAYGARLTAVPAEVGRHDRQAEALLADLEMWLRDTHRRLGRELADISQVANTQQIFHGGIHAERLAAAKTEALRKLRDRRAQYARAIAEIQSAEQWPHDRWRRWSRKRKELEAVEPPWLSDLRDAWARPIVGMGVGSLEVADPASEAVPVLEELPDHAPGD